MSAVELRLSLYVPCRSGVPRASPRKCTKEEWLASPSAVIVHNCIAAGRIAVAGTVVGHTAVDTVVARTAVVVDIAMVVVPRAAVAVEAVLVHRAAGVDPDYNS